MVLPPLGLMSLHSRASTPRSMLGELPAEDEELVMEGLTPKTASSKGPGVNTIGGLGAVKVIGADDHVEAAVKMDVYA